MPMPFFVQTFKTTQLLKQNNLFGTNKFVPFQKIVCLPQVAWPETFMSNNKRCITPVLHLETAFTQQSAD